MQRDDPVDLWKTDDTVAMKQPSWIDRGREMDSGDDADDSPAGNGTGNDNARQNAAASRISTTWLS